MTASIALGLLVAAANVAAARWVESFTRGSDPTNWAGLQAGVFFLRLAAIMGVAGAVWRWTGRSDRVAAFVVTGALAQMAGQIGFWMADERKRGRRKETDGKA